MTPGGFWTSWNIAACETGRRWDEAPGPLDERRIHETIASIPRGVRRVLDAGCGNGWLCNRLAERYRAVGLDYAAEALRHVQTPKVRGSLRQLPFPNQSFDLVVCCETIEHIDDRNYPTVLRELVRVSKRYVLLTVPNDEDLGVQYYRCPRCRTKFSPFGHLRSFAEPALRALFRSCAPRTARCLAIKGIVPVAVYRQNRTLTRLRPEKAGFWLKESRAVCPCCRFAGYDSRLRLFARTWTNVLRLANGALNPVRIRRSCWLLALYEVGEQARV